MRNRPSHKPAENLRYAIECLPLETKRAMLDGIRANPIIVGAYVDGDGGVCPMLAAHRNGGRTSFASFAKAWDRYTGAQNRARRASVREVRTLTTMLESSITDDPGIRGPLGEAVAEHHALVERRSDAEPAADRRVEDWFEGDAGETPSRRKPTRKRHRMRDTGERHRGAELRGRQGWAWTRVFRRYEDYEAALVRFEQLEREHAPAADPHREHELV